MTALPYNAFYEAQEILGCEAWEPPLSLVELLKKHLSPDRYWDFGAIREVLKSHSKDLESSHVCKLSHILSGTETPFRLTHRGVRDLERDAEVWRRKQHPKQLSRVNFRNFIVEWLAKHSSESWLKLQDTSYQVACKKIFQQIHSQGYFEVEENYLVNANCVILVALIYTGWIVIYYIGPQGKTKQVYRKPSHQE